MLPQRLLHASLYGQPYYAKAAELSYIHISRVHKARGSNPSITAHFDQGKGREAVRENWIRPCGKRQGKTCFSCGKP